MNLKNLQHGKLVSLLDIMGANITCDGCGATTKSSLSLSMARGEASENGWTFIGRDLCGECTKKRSASEEESDRQKEAEKVRISWSARDKEASYSARKYAVEKGADGEESKAIQEAFRAGYVAACERWDCRDK